MGTGIRHTYINLKFGVAGTYLSFTFGSIGRCIGHWERNNSSQWTNDQEDGWVTGQSAAHFEINHRSSEVVEPIIENDTPVLL